MDTSTGVTEAPRGAPAEVRSSSAPNAKKGACPAQSPEYPCHSLFFLLSTSHCFYPTVALLPLCAAFWLLHALLARFQGRLGDSEPADELYDVSERCRERRRPAGRAGRRGRAAAATATAAATAATAAAAAAARRLRRRASAASAASAAAAAAAPVRLVGPAAMRAVVHVHVHVHLYVRVSVSVACARRTLAARRYVVPL